ncbi:MAG TPA: DUF523 domain-containing protein [Symbiobacteriaceae bacterium]|nr:DUF523 domain-containing protein [Symbiobacteriaceae bacterium]
MILVSACLAGCNCRYDGKNKTVAAVERLLREGQAIPVCPEQMGGLSTPRLPSEIVGGSGEDVLSGTARVVDSAGHDVTAQFIRGAAEVLELALAVGADTVVLKERSPSCGSTAIYDGTFTGAAIPGMGVTAAMLQTHGIRVSSEESFSEPY